MALPSDPDRDAIYNELIASNFRNGGVDTNGLKEMWNYVFGSGSYNRDAFGGYGTPVIDNIITTSDASTGFVVNFTVNNAANLSWTAYVKWWEAGTTPSAGDIYIAVLANGSGTGSFSGTLSQGTPCTGGTAMAPVDDVDYTCMVTLVNKFNNTADFTCSTTGAEAGYLWSQQTTATAGQGGSGGGGGDTYGSLSSFTVVSWGSGSLIEVDWTYDGPASGFEATAWLNGTEVGASLGGEPSGGWSTSGGLNTGYISPTQLPTSGDSVQVALRVSDVSGKGNWSYSDIHVVQ